MKRRLLILCTLMFTFGTVLYAQTYELRAVNKGGGNIGVEMRVTSGTAPTTSNYITDLNFALKWLGSYNVDLSNSITTNYGLVKSGVRQTNGVYHYQVFNASNAAPYPLPTNLTLNSWVEILSVRNTLTGSGVGNFEIAEAGFVATADPNIGVDLVDFTPTIGGTAINVPLPVSLVSFEAVPKKTVIQLNWTTRNEHLNKGFEIERSDKPNGNYQKLGWVAGKGAAGGNYTWTDNEVRSGIKYYYRLKEVDQDDQFRYSETRTAQLEGKGILAVNLIPNPAERVLQVVILDGSITGRIVVKITDAKGTLVATKTQELLSRNKIEVDVFALPGGQYFLAVEDASGLRFSGSFLKR